MPFARAKKGTQRLYSQGQEYLLDGAFQELPPALAAEIAPHVNVEVVDKLPTAESATEPEDGARAKAKAKG